MWVLNSNMFLRCLLKNVRRAAFVGETEGEQNGFSWHRRDMTVFSMRAYSHTRRHVHLCLFRCSEAETSNLASLQMAQAFVMFGIKITSSDSC